MLLAPIELKREMCPVCKREAEPVAHAVVAPFVRELAKEDRWLPSSYQRCDNCKLNFFGHRYSDQQLSELYGKYRGSEYFEIRRKWEPWYSVEVNEAFNHDGLEVQNRRTFMEKILREAGVLEPIACVLDFGGDRGQFFPDFDIKSRVLLDTSDVPISEDITRIHSLGEIGDVAPNLIIASHVLEHLNDPLAVIQDLKKILASDGLIYIEVPLDAFRCSKFHSRQFYARGLKILVSLRFAFTALDLLTGISRQYRKCVPRFGIVKESEHINYWSVSSLENFIRIAGLEIVTYRSDPDFCVGRLRLGRLGVVARSSALGQTVATD